MINSLGKLVNGRFDPRKFEDILQLGGIRTGTLDYPNPNGGQSCRVAHFNTGSGLRFTVAIDRGGDLVEAAYNDTNLAFLTRNGYKLPNHAYHREYEWLFGWPGGLLTTGGPELMGEPRVEDSTPVSLHGRFSNTPASVDSIVNPDPRSDRAEMSINMTIRDTCVFGPNIEVRRKISCVLGESAIELVDEVNNVGNSSCKHALLYHVTLGYPLVDGGCRLICGGRGKGYFQFSTATSNEQLNLLKKIPDSTDQLFGGKDQRGGMFVTEPPADEEGLAHVGIINQSNNLGLELSYPIEAMPRVGIWQYFGDGGSFLTAFEPFSGSIFGKEKDNHPSAQLSLHPGESKRYQIMFHVLSSQQELQEFRDFDSPLVC